MSNQAFPGVIRIDLTKLGEQAYEVTEAERLWLAKFVAIGNQVKANAFGNNCPIVGIRIQERSNDQLPWAIKDGYMNTFTGKFDRIFVTVFEHLSVDTELFLNTGNGVAGSYCNPDGLSPAFGGGGSSFSPNL